MTADLVQFLRARLDEDALWATEASRDRRNLAKGGVHWHWVSGETDTEITPNPSQETTIGEEVEGSVSLRSREEWPTTSGMGDLPQIALYADEVLSTVGGHIVRHDPARVLAEVDAKRRILGLHNIPAVVSPKMAAFGLRKGESPEDDRRCAGCGLDSMDDPITPDVSACPILRALALPYADHPDYNPEWAPDQA